MSKGHPWTEIQILPASAVKPSGARNSVCVTALWARTTVSDAVKTATLIRAARFYERRDNVAGPLTVKEIDDVRYGWAASGANQELDRDVLASISAYRKIWAAA